MTKEEWKVKGMTCANCALAITRYLEKQGLNDVKVNLISGDVSFTSENTIAEEKLKKGIKGLGYEVDEASPSAKQKSSLLKTPIRKFWFCLPFTFLLWLPMFSEHLHWLMNPWVQLSLAIPVIVVGLGYFGKSAINSIKNRVPNMNVLIALGAASAFIYSLLSSLYNPQTHALYYESAATIITIVLVGYWLEDVSIAKTQESLKALSGTKKTMANMIAFDDEHKELIFPVEASSLRTGDLILIKSGEQVPADAKILWGNGSVNESIITGESLPVEKQGRDLLIGGSILGQGTIKAQVTAIGNESVLGKIIDLAKQAQADKAPIQRLADRVSAVFVPAVIGIAIISFLINYFIADIPFAGSLMRSIAVLVISCPCAMGLATPAAIAVGIGRAARSGILFKNAKSLEQFKNIRQVVFDKTGTLTTGKFAIAAYEFNDIEESEFKSICYSLEKLSNHPIAQAITRSWKDNKVLTWKNYEEIKGSGVKATDRSDNEYRIGSARSFPGFETYKNHSIYLARNNTLLGWIDVQDELRPEASEVINYLKGRSIKTILLSGDSANKCRQVVSNLGIDEMYAEQSPQQKVEVIAKLSADSPLAMVGDGINDAAALAKATIGIAVSDASHVAIQNAQVVLMNSGIKNLPLALQLGKQTYLTICQNLFWAFFYNVIAIPVAAAGFLTPGIAAFAMGFSDIILVANSLRLKWKKPD